MANQPGSKAATSPRKFDRELVRGTLIPRAVQIALGLWMIASVFSWPHSRVQAVVAWSTGGLTVLMAVFSIWISSFRMLLALAAAWLLVGTLIAPAHLVTVVNNLACAIAILLLSFLPKSDEGLFRRAARRGEAH